MGICRLQPVPSDASNGPDSRRSWLGNLPIDPREPVYVCWHSAQPSAIVTNWGTFVAVWDNLWYPFDAMSVFDETAAWAVVLGPESYAAFVRPGPVDPSLPASDPAWGSLLIRAAPDES